MWNQSNPPRNPGTFYSQCHSGLPGSVLNMVRSNSLRYILARDNLVALKKINKRVSQFIAKSFLSDFIPFSKKVIVNVTNSHRFTHNNIFMSCLFYI